MHTQRFIRTYLLSGLLALSFINQTQAEDIDIYSGIATGTSNTPNLMFVIDSSANSDAAMGTCSYDSVALGDGAGGAPSNGSKTLGNEQCALVNIAQFLPVRSLTDPTTGVTDNDVALINLGISNSDGVYFKLTPIDNKPYTGTYPATSGSTNRQAFIQAVKAITKHTGSVDQGDMMQETWAYYTGGVGTRSSGTNVNTGKGLISGTVYSGTNAISGCMKNYAVYLGAIASSSHFNDAGNASGLLNDAVTLYENSRVTTVSPIFTQAMANTQITNLTTGYIGLQPDKYGGISPTSVAREWARFMYVEDINSSSTAAGTQSIITYAISVGSNNDDAANFIADMAKVGGGKSFAATTYQDIYKYILKILNEVQAVNSVFSSSSLPVSVNAQGTFLNQIFMGMFRPDAGGNPRWVGNLKQYQFIYSPSTGLQLGDSLGLPAISSNATGFISANAISFWTCSNLTTTPYPNTYLTNILTAAERAKLVLNLQNCIDTTSYPNLLPNGFWTADPASPTAAALGFDLPDGERVDRGGSAQQIRLHNLIDNYADAAGSSTNPRRLYTYCPSGTSCVAALTDPSNAFSLSNTNITAAQFGASAQLTVSSIVRTGTTALVTTSIPHGFALGSSVSITGATQSEYNVTQNISAPSSTTTFTITGLPDNPPTPNTGTYTAALHNSSAQAITSMSVATGTTATPATLDCSSGTIPNINCDKVTVNLPGHGYSSGNSIVIAGVSPAAYSGTFAITRIDNDTFTYKVPVTPTSPSANAYSVTLPPNSLAISSITYANGSNKTTVTVNNSFTAGQSVTIAGSSIAANNGTYTVASPTSTNFKITGGGASCASNCGTVTLVNPVISIAVGNISRASATATIATGVAASALTSGTTYNLAYVSGVGTNETAYAPYLSGSRTVVITCVSGTTCTTFTFPITTAPSTTLTLSSPSAALSGTLVNIPAGAITRTAMGTTATVTGVPASTFASGNFIDLSVSGSAIGTESAYLSPAAGWQITCSGTCTSFTFGPVTLSPTTPATGAIKVYQGSTPPDKTTVINWVRGDDNVGDENSVCPQGNTAGTTPCPNPVVTIRPSVHGDVLHARPTVLNYGSHSVAITGTSDSGTVRTATASAADVTTITTTGAVPVVTFANGDACAVTVQSATSFTYQNTLCGATGAQSAAVGSKVVVYYGDNGGVLHAVNGNLSEYNGTAGPGDEMWGFIPQDFFGKLGRQMSNSPALLLPSSPTGIIPAPLAKDYFIDGEPGVYQTIDGTGNTTKAVIYLTMRRGGNFIYALDVTTPAAPSFLWKVDPTGITTPSGFTSSTDYQELGQTWSQPKVARVRGYCNIAASATPAACSSTNLPSPVLIFGAGYDTNEDSEPISTMDASGRGIFVLDALTGAVIWKATYTSGSTSYSGTTTKASALVSGMDYSIPSAITLLDHRGSDGYIDRLYAADTGGNIWRVDLEPSKTNAGGVTCTLSSYGCTPDVWRIYRLAALGGYTGACGSTPCNPTQRKFFYPPEVITATSTYNYDSVIAGSGDREHPLYVSASTQRYNRIFLVKDTYTGDDATGMTTPITLNGSLSLFDATSTPWDGSLNGYYITLDAGEKVVNAPLVTAGYVYMGTNQPAAPSTNSCISNLGIAKGYQLNPFIGTAKSVTFDGGGLPPSPVSGVADIVVDGVVRRIPFLIGGGNPECVGSDCKSALGGQKPPITVSTKRTRTYRYIENK